MPKFEVGKEILKEFLTVKNAKISFSNVFGLQARDLESLNYTSTRSLNLLKVLNIYSKPIDTLSTAWEHLTDLSEK